MSKRYYSLDAAKFAFTLMIAVYHFWGHYGQSYRGGFIAVEFFFIVSGFLLMRQNETQGEKLTPVQYTWKRIKKFYPHYIFSFLVIFIYKNVFEYRNTIAETAQNFLKQATEIFMLYGSILSDKNTRIYNSMTWYLTALLIVGYILWALLKSHKDRVLQYAPILVFWIYSYMCYTIGHTNNWRGHVFEVLDYAMLRGIAGMLLGVIVYHVYQQVVSLAGTELHKVRSNTGGRYTLCGTSVLALAFIASYKWFHRVSFFYIVCFAIGVVFLTAGEELSTRTFPKPVLRVIDWMSRISYAVYLNHYVVFYVLKHYVVSEYHHWVIPVYLLVLILYSMLTTKLIELIIRCLKSVRKPAAA